MDPYRFLPSERTAATIEEFLEGCHAEPTLAADQLHQGYFEPGLPYVDRIRWHQLMPVTTHSLHAIGDRGFAEAIADFCARERVGVAHAVDELEESSPFRKAAK